MCAMHRSIHTITVLFPVVYCAMLSHVRPNFCPSFGQSHARTAELWHTSLAVMNMARTENSAHLKTEVEF